MIVHPHREPPVSPAVARLLDEGQAVDETGTVHDLASLPAGIRVFAPWEQVDELVKAGVGEALTWGEDSSEPIRWRHRRFGDAYRRKSDVVVVKLVYPAGTDFLAGLVEWRDWLARHGAAAGWSLGGTSMSLLRATLTSELVTTNGELPPARWTLGGRQHAAVEPGATVPGAVQLDLPSAYSRTIGKLRYGGVWRKLADRPDWEILSTLAAAGLPILLHGRVTLGAGLHFGPLPRRPRRKPETVGADDWTPQQAVPYPTGGRFQGLFTWAEVAAAVEHGCRFHCDTAYVHVTRPGSYPFAAWLDACLDGRESCSSWFGRLLAKATANALWGQFVIDDEKTLAVHRWDEGRHSRYPVGNQHAGHQLRAWDLGEIVCGSVRARLYRLMEQAGGRLVCAHTDGGWVAGDEFEADGFEEKAKATVLQVLDQQHLRWKAPYSHGRWRYAFSGVPASTAPRVFERIWKVYAREET